MNNLVNFHVVPSWVLRIATFLTRVTRLKSAYAFRNYHITRSKQDLTTRGVGCLGSFDH